MERIPDENAPEGYVEQVPAGVETWTVRFVLVEHLTDTAAIISKASLVPDTNGVVLVPVARSDYPAGMPPGTYQHVLFRTDTGSWRVVSWGPAYLHPKVAVA